MSQKLAKLRAIMADANLDVCALIPGANFFYLTGAQHHLMERPTVLFIPQAGDPCAVIPNLEASLFKSHGFPARLVEWHDAEGYDGAFRTVAEALDLNGRRLGVEGQRIRFFEVEAIRRAAPQAEVIDAHKTLSAMRLHKSADEIEQLKMAIKLSEDALRRTLAETRVGMTERQVLNRLTGYLNQVGGHGHAFDPIVLGGANSAKPHGVPGDYVLQSGDPLLIDFGTTYNGYNADITRTFFMERVSDEFRAIYEAVKRANALGRETTKAGVTAHEVDSAVLESLVGAGYEALIVHKTGHGLGLDVHEDPYIMRGNHQPLEAGMVFTVEPGLYQDGALGVRIEDNVVVTEDGCGTLTTFDRDLTIIGG